jgi:hypothetical protein
MTLTNADDQDLKDLNAKPYQLNNIWGSYMVGSFFNFFKIIYRAVENHGRKTL